METKLIKEEATDKEYSEIPDRAASLRSRTKVTTCSSTNKPLNDRSSCRSPESPESSRLSVTQTTSSTTTSSTSSQGANQHSGNHNRSSLSPNPPDISPPLSRMSNGGGGRSSSSPTQRATPENLANTPPLSLTVETPSSNSVSVPATTTSVHCTGQYVNYTSSSIRQLAKVKRFLCTLVQFGADIGTDIGDRVKSLVLSLVSSNLSIEEFHQALQEVTNFPLRPFVLPFLRTHLPLLQREIHSLARSSKQSSLQYVRTHEHVVLDPTFSPSEASEIFLPTEPSNLIHKRRASDSYYENGISSNGQTAAISLVTSGINQQEPADYTSPPSKRQMTSTPLHHHTPFLLSTGLPAHTNFFLPNNFTHNLQHYDAYAQNSQSQQTMGGNNKTIDNENNDISSAQNLNFQNKFGLNLASTGNRGDEEWKNIHVMLNCILSMVEKTKRALTILQQRNCQDQTNEWLRKQDIGIDLKKAANEIMIQAIRQAEDRVAEVKRKAEEAVQDVKKQAVIELQKAVQLAESKACELVATERAKIEKMLIDARKHPNEELLVKAQHIDGNDNSQSPPIQTQPATSSQNSCWNCGRKANETCSGCNVARYCGSFCQHKDWENHHSVCCQQQTTNKPVSMVTVNANKQQTVGNPGLKPNAGGPISRDGGKTPQQQQQRNADNSSRTSTPVSSTAIGNSNAASRRTDRDTSGGLLAK